MDAGARSAGAAVRGCAEVAAEDPGGKGPRRGEAEEVQYTRILPGKTDRQPSPRDVLLAVHRALQEKGYDPIRQIAHYLLSGEPAYITAHQGARSLITRCERDEILEELVAFYLAHLGGGRG
jgi:uncharacterized protein (UPF0297 family)